MKPQPFIAVTDVEAASRWYQEVLGFESGHGGNEYEQLLSNGEMVLQLHHWDVDEHPHNHREVWLRDPNGYVVVIAGAYGDI